MHSRMEGILARADDVPFEINGILRIWCDGEDSDLIATLNLERLQLLHYVGGLVILRNVECQHRLLLMGDSSLDFDVSQSCGWQETAGKSEYIGQEFFVFLLVDCRPAHHTFDCDLRTKRRNHNGIATLKALHITLYAMQE